MYKCIVFDFDGTIGDTEDLAIQVARSLAEKYNFRKVTRAEIPMIRSMTAKEVIGYMGVSRFRLPFILREAHKILRDEVSAVNLCRISLHDFFRKLKNSNLIAGIITSNARENVEAFLRSQGIDVFDFIKTSSIFGKAKHFRKLLVHYDLEPSQMLYVGDEARDIHAAKKAGIDVAAVTWGFNTRERLEKEKPDYLIDDVCDLERVVDLSKGAGY